MKNLSWLLSIKKIVNVCVLINSGQDDQNSFSHTQEFGDNWDALMDLPWPPLQKGAYLF